MDDKGLGGTQKVFCKRSLTGLIILLIIILLFILSAFTVYKGMGLTLCVVSGNSMSPTIEDEAILLLNPKKELERFDILVFEEDDKYMLKRLIGLPGDTVTVMDGHLFVNGDLYHEPYLDEDYCKNFKEQDFKITVPDRQYFLLGDNRDGSFDSRQIGMIDKDQIVGTGIFVFGDNHNVR